MNNNTNKLNIYTDVSQWIKEHRNVVFRYWVYRRMFTPYEMDEKFDDETEFSDVAASTGYIREATILPDNDILIGFMSTDPDLWDMEYYKLSEIRLGFAPHDQYDNDDEDDSYEEEYMNFSNDDSDLQESISEWMKRYRDLEDE